MQISVVGQKAQVIHQGSTQNNRQPRLWRFNPKTGAVKEIAFLLPSGLAAAGKTPVTPEEVSKTTLINVPDLEELKIDS